MAAFQRSSAPGRASSGGPSLVPADGVGVIDLGRTASDSTTSVSDEFGDKKYHLPLQQILDGTASIDKSFNGIERHLEFLRNHGKSMEANSIQVRATLTKACESLQLPKMRKMNYRWPAD